MPDKLIDDKSAKQLSENFKALKDDVLIEVFTEDGANQVYNDFALRIVGEISALEPRIKLNHYKKGDKKAEERSVSRFPTILIAPDKYNIRFTGAPSGEEGRSLVYAILFASIGTSILTKANLDAVAGLDKKRAITVFVSPT